MVCVCVCVWGGGGGGGGGGGDIAKHTLALSSSYNNHEQESPFSVAVKYWLHYYDIHCLYELAVTVGSDVSWQAFFFLQMPWE